MVNVLVTPNAEADFNGLPAKMQARVASVIERLTKWPEVSGAKPLRRDWAGHYRIRTGDWRVVFRVAEDGQVTIVVVVRIANRKDVYE